ncbi:MAG TPA: rod shape-determining protein RodA [Candidatus Kapabacteria bacterium]|jgi:rod shape determining protein RodA|nr:rod shape-determining protein RodA [Candidatus Kapabacteria bacterium]
MSTTFYDDAFETAGSRSLPFDFRTFMVTIGLVAMGLISIYSATNGAGQEGHFTSQLVYAIGGVFVMLGIAFAPERWVRLSAFPLYGFGLLLLVAVLLIGTVKYGAKSWIVLGPLVFQPSEIGKLGTMLMAATFVAREGKEVSNWRDLGTLVGIVALPIGLIMLEPDFGSSTVYVMLLMGIALWSGADLFLLFALVAPAFVGVAAFFGPTPMYVALGVVLLAMISFRRSIVVTLLGFAMSVSIGFSTGYVYENVLKPHQQKRIQSFLDPNLDPKGAGYHVIQSMLAVGSGGLTGKGFLNGTQTQLKYIPEQWTDFIFCVPTEEFGFLGGMLVLTLLISLIYFAVDTASHLRNKFESTICFGIATIFLYHTVINVGMAIGLVPVMGIPLPFLSKGGSSLLLNMSMVGLLLNFYRYRTDVRRA